MPRQPFWVRPADVPFSQHDPRWYARPAAEPVPRRPVSTSAAVTPKPPRRRYAFTTAQRRQGGLSRAARLTAVERSEGARQAARERWSHPRWASPAVRRRVALALIRARRGEAPAHPMPRRVPLIPASPPRPSVTHPSHAPRACWCGAEARPFRRAPLLTNVWVWRCPAHAFEGPAEGEGPR
jgi:hypothetical protein